MEFTKEKIQEEITRREQLIMNITNSMMILQESKLKTIGQIDFLKDLLNSVEK